MIQVRFFRGTDKQHYMTLYFDSIEEMQPTLSALLKDKLFIINGDDRIEILDNYKLIDKYTLCFSCDIGRMKYVTGLCEECHQTCNESDENFPGD